MEALASLQTQAARWVSREGVRAQAPLHWVAEPAAERWGTVKTCKSTSGPLGPRKRTQNNHEPAENQGLKCGLPLWLLFSLL